MLNIRYKSVEGILISRKMATAEKFIGWKSEDGKLEVIGIHGKQGRNTLFKVTCTECSKDPELFPDGYFVSQKNFLEKNHKPCGCAKNHNWKAFQYLILARRAGEGKFTVHGFSDEFRNNKTKLNLECLKDGHRWEASVSSILNNKYGCPKCGGTNELTEQEALQRCIDICKEMNYDVIGFVDGYKGATKTRFEYVCKIHGKKNVSYNNFVNNKRRCKGCIFDLGKVNESNLFNIEEMIEDHRPRLALGGRALEWKEPWNISGEIVDETFWDKYLVPCLVRAQN